MVGLPVSVGLHALGARSGSGCNNYKGLSEQCKLTACLQRERSCDMLRHLSMLKVYVHGAKLVSSRTRATLT